MPPRRKKQSSSSSTEFPLLQALFDFPDAQPGRPQPQESGPDAWVAQFVRTAGSEVRQVLYKSCRAGRDLVLQHAADASVEVNAAAEQGEGALSERLSAVRQGLLVRGRQPTTLCLTHRSEDSASLLSLLPSKLLHGGAGAGISSLLIHEGPTSDALAAFLQQAIPLLPNLMSLTTFSTPSTLPTATQLPKLRELSLELPDRWQLQPGQLDSLFASIGQLLPQITSLSLGDVGVEGEEDYPPALYPWPLLLSPDTTTHTLTHLDLWGAATLNAQILSLLLECVPQLKELTVSYLAGLAEGFSDRVWGLEVLSLTEVPVEGLAGRLAGLPRPRQGRTRVEMIGEFFLDASTSQGLDPAFVARLGDFEFRGVYVQLSASDELSTHQHPNALRNALRQLGALHATARPCNPATITPLARVHPELHLQGWDWEQEGMAEAVSDYMPELPMLNRFVKVDMHEPLTDGRLGAVLALGQHVHGVSVGSLDLHTDAHAYDAWPWEWFECHGFVLNNTQLFRLPHPRSYKGRKPRPVVKLVDSWILNVGKKDIPRMKEWLTYVDLQSCSFHGPRFILLLPYTQDKLRQVKDQMSLLDSVKYPDWTNERPLEHSARLELKHWYLDTNALQYISYIPRFYGILDLTTCTWPLQSVAYERLGRSVRSEIRWLLFGPDVPEGVVKSIAAGVNLYRGGGYSVLEGRDQVHLRVPSHKGPDKRVGSCVVITNRFPHFPVVAL